MLDVASLCSELVKIRSENPPGYTDEVIAFLQDICSQIGVETEIIQKGRKHNLLSKKRGIICSYAGMLMSFRLLMMTGSILRFPAGLMHHVCMAGDQRI
jgi:acetylornithine deacetylase/succinyl-diaminopimelate desuccinylase-like protein